MVALIATLAAVATMYGAASVQAAPASRAGSLPGVTSAGTPLFLFNSGLVLSDGGGHRPGVVVTVQLNASAAGQSWQLRPDGTVRPSYDRRLCLNVRRAAYAPGTPLTVAACDGAARERFVTRAPSAHTSVFAISPSRSGKLCVSIGEMYRGAGVFLAKCRLTSVQEWSRSSLASTVAKVSVLGGGESLGAVGAGGAGTPVLAMHAIYDLGLYWIAVDHGAPGSPGQTLEFHPEYNTALCLSVNGAEASGTGLDLRRCTGSGGQEFLTVQYHPNGAWQNIAWYLTTNDSTYCLRAATNSALTLAPCLGDGRDQWFSYLNLMTSGATNYQVLYVGDNQDDYALQASGDTAAAPVVLGSARDQYYGSAGQLWQPMPSAPGDPGYPFTTTLHSFGDIGACLTVAGAQYAAGTALQAQPCDGAPDQGFLRAVSGVDGAGNYSLQQLMPYAGGQMCADAQGGITAGSEVELEPCAGTAEQSWFGSFYSGWGAAPEYINAYPVHAGALPSPGPLLGLSSAGATSAPAVVSPTQEGRPAQLWLPEPGTGGTTFVSVANTSWCLAAPSYASGTQLVATACDGAKDQEFVAVGVSDVQYVEYQSAGDPSECVTSGVTTTSGPAVLQPCSAMDTAQMWWSYQAG
jgi:hypothetical protein